MRFITALPSDGVEKTLTDNMIFIMLITQFPLFNFVETYF
jgi:hypothetical protein